MKRHSNTHRQMLLHIVCIVHCICLCCSYTASVVTVCNMLLLPMLKLPRWAQRSALLHSAGLPGAGSIRLHWRGGQSASCQMQCRVVQASPSSNTWPRCAPLRHDSSKHKTAATSISDALCITCIFHFNPKLTTYKVNKMHGMLD